MYSQQLITLLEEGINEENMAWFHEEFLPVVVRRLSILSDQEHEVFLMSGTFLYSFLCSESDAASYLYERWGQVNKYDFATPGEVCYYLIKYRRLQLASPDARKFNEVKVVDPRAGWLTKFEANLDYTKRIDFKTRTFHIGKSNMDNARMSQIMHRNYKRANKYTVLETKRRELIALHQHYVREGGEFVDVRKMYDQYVLDIFYEGRRGHCELDVWFMNQQTQEGVFHGIAYNPGLVLPRATYRRNEAFEHYLDMKFQAEERIDRSNVPTGCMIDARDVCVFEPIDPIITEHVGFDEEDNYVYDYDEERVTETSDPVTFDDELRNHMLNKLREIFADEKVKTALLNAGLTSVSVVKSEVQQPEECQSLPLPETVAEDEVEEPIDCVPRPADRRKGALLVSILATVSGFTPGVESRPFWYYYPTTPAAYRAYQAAYYDYFYSLNPKRWVAQQDDYYALVKRSLPTNVTDDLGLMVKTQPYRSDLMLNSSTAQYYTDSAHGGVDRRRVVDSSAASGKHLIEVSKGLGLLMWFACGFM